MKACLPDVNVWLALTLKGHVHHTSAMEWYYEQSREHSIAFCRQTQTGLFRLLTTAAVMAPHRLPAFTNKEAWRIQQNWALQPEVHFADEPAGLEQEWHSLGAIRHASPKLWMDAYLAAFSSCAGFQMVTTDKAFRQFKGVEVLVIG